MHDPVAVLAVGFIAVMLPIGTHRAWVVVVLILLCSIHSLLAAPVQQDLGQSEAAPNKLNMTVKGVFESLLNFFRPMTCRLSNERPLIPCQVESLNASECLKNHCCPMKIGQDLQCHMPVKDVNSNMHLILKTKLKTPGLFDYLLENDPFGFSTEGIQCC
ncbi:fragile X mental retardation 1 neighbor protein-like protein [Pitangus sulphuratus]|nr:fragile X mental retardation 1 neighbor protein-like protein [Pitangus sulphuratus]